MIPQPERRGLYYPFHLCHEQTLHRLLEDYASVHFRDYMALQLTPLTGLTAYNDRMGDRYPDLIAAGRIVQGYSVSGPLDDQISSEIDRDFADLPWREAFHDAITEDRRFQRGLFELSHAVRIGQSLVPGPAALLRLTERQRTATPYSTRTVKEASLRHPQGEDEGYDDEYGLALLKTAAALAFTVRLALRHNLEAITDSAWHYKLLSRTMAREGCNLLNAFISREGY